MEMEMGKISGTISGTTSICWHVVNMLFDSCLSAFASGIILIKVDWAKNFITSLLPWLFLCGGGCTVCVLRKLNFVPHKTHGSAGAQRCGLNKTFCKCLQFIWPLLKCLTNLWQLSAASAAVSVARPLQGIMLIRDSYTAPASTLHFAKFLWLNAVGEEEILLGLWWLLWGLSG